MRNTIRPLSCVLQLCFFIPGVRAETANQVFERIVENWRWSHYWFGKTGLDDAYVPGKKISALIFWNRSEDQPIRGLCSSELGRCVAYAGIYLDPHERQVPLALGTSLQQAFASWVNGGLRDPSFLVGVQGFAAADFQSETKSLTLPAWEPPSSITQRTFREEARRQAEKIRRTFGCWGVEADTRPQECGGSLVFAFYGDNDPYWFVLRSCATACEFKGESVEMLRRGDHGWDVTVGGFINSPKEEVERLKQQIEKAEMFRLQL